MAIYEAFRAASLPCKLRPVLDDAEERHEELLGRLENGSVNSDDEEVKECLNQPGPDQPKTETIGENVIGLKITEAGRECYWDEVLSEWQPYTRDKITWLKRGGIDEVALVYLAYGNNASVGCKYARLAIIVDVGPFHEHRYPAKGLEREHKAAVAGSAACVSVSSS